MSASITIHNLHKTLGNKEILKGIDLHIPAGQVVSIIGPSGSGKTTLLRSINFLETPNSGFISINDELIGFRQQGNKLYPLPESQLRNQRRIIGFVFQQFHLFPHLTVLENIILAPVSAKLCNKTEAIHKAKILLLQMELSDKIHAYPRELSGGQQQRVAIARALALEPEVIVFDEPTSALDPLLANEVNKVIATLSTQGRTLVIVTHELEFARKISDRIIFIDEGAIIESGTPEQILDNPQHPRLQFFLSHNA